MLLTIINIVDVKSGARFQNVFTYAKLGAILGVIYWDYFSKVAQLRTFLPFSRINRPNR